MKTALETGISDRVYTRNVYIQELLVYPCLDPSKIMQALARQMPLNNAKEGWAACISYGAHVDKSMAHTNNEHTSHSDNRH